MQVSPAGQGDDKATFLAEFRMLRDRAAIDCEELAVRAHFPTDVIRAAESGPELPGLPVLAAYVRACGGDVIEWEERWRRLATDGDIDSGLPMRPPGASPAAVAGARAGVTIAAAEAHDPERIKAALRAHREREGLAGHGRATAHQDARPSSGITTPAGGPATMIANGNHHKKPRPDGFNAWMAPTPEEPHAAQDPRTGGDPVSRPTEPREPGPAEAREPGPAEARETWDSGEAREYRSTESRSAEPREMWDSGVPTEKAPGTDVWTPARSSRIQEPSVWTHEPPAQTEEPSVWTQEPPARTQEPSVWTQEPPAQTEEPSVWTQEPPARTQEPSVWTREPAARNQEPSVWTHEPPTGTQEPSVWTHEPPAGTQEPPTWTQEPPARAQEPSVWRREPPVPAAEQAYPVIGASDEPVPAASAAEATETDASWDASAASEVGTARPPVAALRAAASETGAAQVTVAQAAAATSAARAKRSGHRALLVLVVFVIIGCIALLIFT